MIYKISIAALVSWLDANVGVLQCDVPFMPLLPGRRHHQKGLCTLQLALHGLKKHHASVGCR